MFKPRIENWFLVSLWFFSSISSTGLLWSTACVNRMVRWGRTAPDCFLRMESSWCVLARAFLCKMQYCQLAALPANPPTSSTLNPALALWWARGTRIWSRVHGAAAIPRPDIPACLLCFWELCRCQGEVQVLHSCRTRMIHRHAERMRGGGGNKRKRGGYARSENSQPNFQATNCCRSQQTKIQLLLM